MSTLKSAFFRPSERFFTPNVQSSHRSAKKPVRRPKNSRQAILSACVSGERPPAPPCRRKQPPTPRQPWRRSSRRRKRSGADPFRRWLARLSARRSSPSVQGLGRARLLSAERRQMGASWVAVLLVFGGLPTGYRAHFRRSDDTSAYHPAVAPVFGLPRYKQRFKAALVPGGACPP